MNIDIESGEGRFETAVRHPVEGRVQRGLASLSCYSRFLCTSQSWWLDNCHTQWVGQHDWKQQQQQPRQAIRWRCCSSWDRKKVRSFKSKVSCPDVCSNGSGFLEVLRSRHDATLTPHRRQLITRNPFQKIKANILINSISDFSFDRPTSMNYTDSGSQSIDSETFGETSSQDCYSINCNCPARTPLESFSPSSSLQDEGWPEDSDSGMFVCLVYD